MAVLVAVADDRMRERVLDTAVRLGRAFDEELNVVHLIDSSQADGQSRTVRDETQAILADERVDFSVSIEHLGRTGARSGKTVGRQLADITADVDITHAVIGHRSKELFQRLVEGDTAFAVAAEASVPVTVVPEAVRPQGDALDGGEDTGRP
jgi:K+-sensing histidine kinase KdpD